MEAQENTVLLKLHNIPAEITIEEPKAKTVELKRGIARAEVMFGQSIQEMQKMNEIPKVIDPSHDFDPSHEFDLSY